MEVRYMKVVINGHILAIGKGEGGTEITEAQYNTILSKLSDKPADIEGHRWLLTESLEWELAELPPVGNDISDSDALNIIIGGG